MPVFKQEKSKGTLSKERLDADENKSHIASTNNEFIHHPPISEKEEMHPTDEKPIYRNNEVSELGDKYEKKIEE